MFVKEFRNSIRYLFAADTPNTVTYNSGHLFSLWFCRLARLCGLCQLRWSSLSSLMCHGELESCLINVRPRLASSHVSSVCQDVGFGNRSDCVMYMSSSWRSAGFLHMAASGFRMKTSSIVHRLLKSLLVSLSWHPVGWAQDQGGGWVVIQRCMVKGHGWMDRGNKKNLWPFSQPIRLLPIRISSSRCSSTQCPTTSLGATASVPSGRGIGETLLEPSHTVLWGCYSQLGGLPNLALWPSQKVCEALDTL